MSVVGHEGILCPGKCWECCVICKRDIRQFQQGSVKSYANVILAGFLVLSHFSESRHITFEKEILLLLRSDQTMAQKMQKHLKFKKM